MKLNSGVYGRKPYHERNDGVGNIEYQASDVAPHVRFLRDSYLVPAGKSIRLDMLDASMIRTAASSAEAEVLMEFEVVLADTTTVTLHSATMFGKLIGSSVDHEHDSAIFLHEGDTLKLFTTDPSPSGTVSYSGRLLFMIFDI